MRRTRGCVPTRYDNGALAPGVGEDIHLGAGGFGGVVGHAEAREDEHGLLQLTGGGHAVTACRETERVQVQGAGGFAFGFDAAEGFAGRAEMLVRDRSTSMGSAFGGSEPTVERISPSAR